LFESGKKFKNSVLGENNLSLILPNFFFVFSNHFKGHTVVGLEGVPFVAEQVFQDAKLEYNKFYLAEIEGFVFKV
jgi:hypothetical protein